MISAYKNGATVAPVTPLRTRKIEVCKVPNDSTTSDVGLIDAIGNLIQTAEDPYCLHRQGLWFEKSGCSMAVYTLKPRPYPSGRAPEFIAARERYIARMDLCDGEYQTFLEAIDEYLMLRYLRECA